MKFSDCIHQILSEKERGLTPQDLREIIKSIFPEHYETENDVRNVDKGHYKDLEHALLDKIYGVSKGKRFSRDTTTSPMVINLRSENPAQLSPTEKPRESDQPGFALAPDVGTVYILGTNLFTVDGRELIKIGITAGDLQLRIDQLYTTGVPFKFRNIDSFEMKGYRKIEQAVHQLLDPYRVSQSREFFTEDCLPFVSRIIDLAKEANNDAR